MGSKDGLIICPADFRTEALNSRYLHRLVRILNVDSLHFMKT